MTGGAGVRLEFAQELPQSRRAGGEMIWSTSGERLPVAIGYDK